jgi:4-alpha-glucanotransferase
VERVPGISELEGIEDLIAAGRALNDSKRVDRDRVLEAKMTALERLWRRSPDVEGPGAFARELGEPLELFATHCALVEKYGREAGSWPSGLRTARSAEVQRFRNSNADRVQFHVWLQWLVDEQLKSAASKMGVIHDLAVGVGPDGADAWTWPGCFTEGITIGAPPDDYSSEGQDWGVAGFDPVQLAAADFEPFIAMVRATMRHAAGIRFDHVMSLFRLFWIPEGLGPSNGCYVRYPSRELLDILSLESHRAETFVIGEDLGTVEEGVRDETHRRKMMSSRLLWFEESDARTLGRLAMASSNTHDLPTTAGLWTGEEVAAQRRRGIEPNVEFLDTMIERIHRHLGVERDAPVDAVIDAAAELLAGSECAVVTVGIEDVVGSVERYNLPGSTGEQNWTTVLPVALEELVRHPRFAAISDLFNRGRR